MELGTFGAILGFAIDLESRSAEFYEHVADREQTEPFRELARGSRKRARRLLRARQELVSEMILESIMGLDGDAYAPKLDPGPSRREVTAQALALEATAASYYRDAGAKMPIREVVRLFDRLATENERRQAKLAAFGHERDLQCA